jgi:dUTPase
MTQYRFKKEPAAILPAKSNPDDSGYDLVALKEPKFVGEAYPNGGWKRLDYIEYSTGIRLDRPEMMSYIQVPGQAIGVCMKYYRKYWTLLFPRSSVSKYNLALANSVGVIDHSYSGEILLRFKYIWQPEDYSVVDGGLVGAVNMAKIYHSGERIGQIVPVELQDDINFSEVDEIGTTPRGGGGFGSTGK